MSVIKTGQPVTTAYTITEQIVMAAVKKDDAL